MKRRTVFAVLLMLSLSLSGCSETGKQPEGEGSEKTVVQNETGNEPGQNGSGTELAEKESCAMRWDRIPMVRVKGENYFDSGYVSSAARCGVPDGQIRSSVDGSQLPEEDDQSNFGSGYNYQFCGEEGIIEVEIDGNWVIFLREDKKQETTIPLNVAHFSAEVIEKDEKGNLVLRLTEVPEDFKHLYLQPGEEFSASMDDWKASSKDAVPEIGTLVEVWFDGMVMEKFPKEMGKVYRIIEKEGDL